MDTEIGLLVSLEDWHRKWLRLDQAIEDMMVGRLCLATLECLERAEVGVRVDVEGREIEVGACEHHAEGLRTSLGESGVRVLGYRPLGPSEVLDGPGGC
ncbi:MAG: hypothetical protein AB7N76_35820 [Planctomycetota bacterium]